MRTPDSWLAALGGDPFTRPEHQGLLAFLRAEEAEHTVFPPPDERLTALQRTPPASVRVVLLGQDPYHGKGQAHGLSFSVKRPRKAPPSLKNVFTELESDLGLARPDHGELTSWADQGVLLLNTVLTVREKKAGSHRKKGWESYTDVILDAVAAGPPVAFLLWGKAAQAKAARIPEGHLVLQAAHPSPYAAHLGFFGCRHFSRVDTWLEARGSASIDWSLP